MPWFKVDDGLHAHRKSARAGIEAMGLWVIAGSWSADQLTDGFIPDYIAVKLDPKAKQHAAALCKAGFWFPHERDGDAGWQFHDWEAHQPSAKSTLEKRAEAKDRMQRLRENRKANRGANSVNGSQPVRANTSGTFAGGSPEVRSTPTRPDPSRPEHLSDVLKPGVADLSGSLPKQDPPEVSKTASKAPWQPPRKRWCDEHGHPNDKDCDGCYSEHHDAGYWSKLPEGEYKRRSAAKFAAGEA
jgi:hypothetical protein